MSLPFLNTAPARTSATRWGALTARHRVCADSMSLRVESCHSRRLTAVVQATGREPSRRSAFLKTEVDPMATVGFPLHCCHPAPPAERRQRVGPRWSLTFDQRLRSGRSRSATDSHVPDPNAAKLSVYGTCGRRHKFPRFPTALRGSNRHQVSPDTFTFEPPEPLSPRVVESHGPHRVEGHQDQLQ
jgi:hypothetical protein